MLILVTRQTVLLDVSRLLIERLALALTIPSSLIRVTWKQAKGGLSPVVDIELPPAPPPADVDVNDPAAMAAWEHEVAEMPGVVEFLQGKGIADPERIIKDAVARTMLEFRVRMDGLERSFRRQPCSG